MKKPRKKYVPKPIRTDTLTYVVSGFKKVADVPDAGTKLLIRNHAAFDEIREGRGTKEHVDMLIHMVNMCEALANQRLVKPKMPSTNLPSVA
jgi:hypothetical protein